MEKRYAKIVERDGRKLVAFAVPGLGIISFLTALFSLGVRRKKAKAE